MSLGALPVGVSPSLDPVLPVAETEAFWIGLSADEPVRVALQVDVIGRGAIDALSGEAWRNAGARSIDAAARAQVAGIAGPNGRWWAFSRIATLPAPASRSIRLLVRGDRAAVTSSVAVALTDYASFTRLTGVSAPAPLDPDAGYKGWRLP